MDYKKEYEKLLTEYNHRVGMLCNELRELEAEKKECEQKYWTELHENNSLRDKIETHKVSNFMLIIVIITLCCEYVFWGYSCNFFHYWKRAITVILAFLPCFLSLVLTKFFAHDYINASKKGKLGYLILIILIISIMMLFFSQNID